MPTQPHVGHQPGVLVDWNDARGFGFVQPGAGGARVFVHVSEFPRGERPVVGDEISFVQVYDDRGRPRAVQARHLRPRRSSRRGRGLGTASAVAAAYLALVGWLVLIGEVPLVLLIGCLVLSAVTLLVYAHDKAAAERDGWRTSESSLHTLALLGGWPGALVARHAFRHKTRKQPFRTIFWVTVIIHVSALTAYVLDLHTSWI